MDAAKYISANEDADVEVLPFSGASSLYVKGEGVEMPVWYSAPMPVLQPGQAAGNLDMTPLQVRLERWHEEAGQFIPSNSLSVQEFLEFHRFIRKPGAAGA